MRGAFATVSAGDPAFDVWGRKIFKPERKCINLSESHPLAKKEMNYR